MKTKTAKFITFIFVLATTSIASLNAGAYVLNGNMWIGSHPRVPYYVSDSLEGNVPTNGTYQDAITAIQNAASEWNIAGLTELNLTYAGETSVSQVADDGINAIIFDPGQCPYGSACMAAATYHQTNGIFHGFDIVLYKYRGTTGTLIGWSAKTSTSLLPWEVDVWTVVLHELGHGLGLAHSQWAGKVMSTDCGTACGRRTLKLDDIDGFQALYGTYTDEGLSASTTTPMHGSSFNLALNYPAAAGKMFLVLLTLKGMTGYPLYNIVPIDSRILAIDYELFNTAAYPKIFTNFLGYLDANGNATATVNIPDNPYLAGLHLYFTAITLDASYLTGIEDVGVGIDVTIQ